MSKSAALLALLLAASCLIAVKPASSFPTVAAENAWTQKAPMPTARGGLGVATVNGKIYAIGGIGGEIDMTIGTVPYSSGFLNTNEAYDPATDTWNNTQTEKLRDSWNKALLDAYDYKSLESVGNQFASAVYNNKIFALSYYIGLTSNKALLIYDSSCGSWNLGSPAPSGIQCGVAAITSGFVAPKRIYFLGPTCNYAYDPENDSWQIGVLMPTLRAYFSSVTVDDKLYVIGGYTSKSGFFAISSAANEVYTPFGYGAVPLLVSVGSPANKVYNTTSVDLVFAVNKPAEWIGYSLDGQDNVTITGNTTITRLSNGLHNVTVYARDEFENVGTSRTISFSVEVPFPTILVIVPIASVAVVGVGLIVYFRKRHH